MARGRNAVITDVSEVKEDLQKETKSSLETEEIFEFNEGMNDIMLDAAVNEKEYSKQNVKFEGGIPENIPSQSIEPPTINLADVTKGYEPEEDTEDEFAPAPKRNQKNEHKNRDNYDFEEREPPFKHHKTDAPENPYLTNDLSPKSKREAAEKFADMILFGYKWIWEMGYRFLNMEEEKVMKKAVRGKFDLDLLKVEIPLSETQSMTVLEFLNDYNEKLYDSCEVDDDFINEVRPVLVRIFEKRGIGMSDEQYLLYLVGQDVVSRATNVLGLKIAVNQMINISKELLQANLSVRASQQAVFEQNQRQQEFKAFQEQQRKEEENKTKQKPEKKSSKPQKAEEEVLVVNNNNEVEPFEITHEQERENDESIIDDSIGRTVLVVEPDDIEEGLKDNQEFDNPIDFDTSEPEENQNN